MHRRYVVLLRAITNVRRQPFRQSMGELGFTDVTSYGASGNLLFSADTSDTASLERRIAAHLGVAAFARARAELARAVAENPFRGRPGAARGDTVDVTLQGTFHIHGVSQETSIPATVVLRPNAVQVRGNTPLNLEDYNIGGLSKALGMLRMQEEIMVHLDLMFAAPADR